MGKRKPLTQEQLERKRKYEREYYHRKRAAMTPEEKKKPLTAQQKEMHRKASLEYYHRKRAAMTPEEKKNPFTEQQKEMQRKYSLAYYHRKRATMTPEEKDAIREKDRIRNKKRKRKPLTEQQLERKRKSNREHARRKWAAMTPVEKDARRKKDRVRHSEKTKGMTEEEKKVHRAKDKVRCERYRANRTPAQKKAISQREAARSRKKRRSVTGKQYHELLAHERKVYKKRKQQLTGAKLERHRAKHRRAARNYYDRRLKVQTKCPHCSVDLKTRSLKDHIKKVHDFCNNRMKPITIKEREEIKRKTCETTLAKNWKTYRRGRITGSKAHSIVQLVRADPYKLVDGMMTVGARRMKIPALERGLKLEPVAVAKFMKLQKIPKSKYEYPVGFCVHPQYSFIGATPDALIRKNACVEIKCPIVPVAKVAARRTTFLKKAKKGEKGGSFMHSSQPQKGHYKFNRNHGYFTQVVLQLMCTGRDKCHLVAYYENDENPTEWEMWMETITKEEAMADWNQRIKPKLLTFYAKYLASKPIPKKQ